MITIYGNAKSRAMRPLWLLEELQIPYEHIKVDPAAGEAQQPAFLNINPCGKIPALVDADLCIFESAAICNYILNRYAPASPIKPQDPAARARCDQWLFYCMAELEQPLWTIAKHRFALKEELRVPAVINTAGYEWHKAQKIIVQHLELQQSPYMLGSEFSVADIFVAQTFMWANTIGFKAESPAMIAYIKRCRQRPGFKRFQEKFNL